MVKITGYFIDTPWHPGKIRNLIKKVCVTRKGKIGKNISRKNTRPLPPRRSIDKKFFFIFFGILGEADFEEVGVKNLDFFQKMGVGDFHQKSGV